MKKYIAPEYKNEHLFDDIVLISIQADGDKITGIVDIEDLFG